MEKTRAIAVNTETGKKKIVAAFDAFETREFHPEIHKKTKYYYSFPNGNQYPVFVKYNTSSCNAFFSFYPNTKVKNDFERSGETLLHYAAKIAISRLEKLNLVFGDRRIELIVDKNKTLTEKEFVFNNNQYYTDVFFRIKTSNPKDYFYKWYEELAVEVVVSHKSAFSRAKAFEENNIPVFEVRIPKSTRERIDLESGKMPTKEYLDEKIVNLQKMFQKQLYGKLISNPSSKEYETMLKYKEEIKAFESRRKRAELEYCEIEKNIEKLKEEKFQLEEEVKKLQLEEEIKKLQLEEEVKKMKTVNERKSFWNWLKRKQK